MHRRDTHQLTPPVREDTRGAVNALVRIPPRIVVRTEELSQQVKRGETPITPDQLVGRRASHTEEAGPLLFDRSEPFLQMPHAGHIYEGDCPGFSPGHGCGMVAGSGPNASGSTHNVIATGLLRQPLIPDRVLLLVLLRGLLLATTCLTSALLLASADPRYCSTTILLSDVTRFSRSRLAPGSRIHQIPSRNSDKDEGYECSGVANSEEPTWHDVPA